MCLPLRETLNYRLKRLTCSRSRETLSNGETPGLLSSPGIPGTRDVTPYLLSLSENREQMEKRLFCFPLRETPAHPAPPAIASRRTSRPHQQTASA